MRDGSDDSFRGDEIIWVAVLREGETMLVAAPRGNHIIWVAILRGGETI